MERIRKAFAFDYVAPFLWPHDVPTCPVQLPVISFDEPPAAEVKVH